MDKETIDKLLSAEKEILYEEGHFIDNYTINMVFPLKIRIILGVKSDENLQFELCITQSSKIQIKISLHLLNDDSKIGISRLDYNGIHRNPATYNEKTPLELRRYVGKWINESHIHYAVDGFSDLAWAIPLKDTDFPIKSIDLMNLYTNFAEAIIAYAKYLNIKTTININNMTI